MIFVLILSIEHGQSLCTLIFMNLELKLYKTFLDVVPPN